MKLPLAIFLSISLFTCYGQEKQFADPLHNAYNTEMKIISDDFSKTYYPNRAAIYSLNEDRFIKKNRLSETAFPGRC